MGNLLVFPKIDNQQHDFIGPVWLAMRRYLMGFVLLALALRLLMEPQRVG